MKTILILFLLFFGLMLSAQEIINRYDPGLHNYFHGGQMLKDRQHKIFSSSYGSSGYSYITDWNPGNQSLQTWFPKDSTFGYPLFYGAYEMFLIALPNDDAILVGNIFDCDIGLVEIIYITPDHEVKWHLSSYDFDIPYAIEEIGLVEKDVMVLLSEEQNIYIGFDGIQRIYQNPPVDYTHVLMNAGSIYGYQDHRYVKLDNAFHIVSSLPVDTISYVTFLGSDLLLQTKDKLVLIYSSLQIKGENETFKDIHGAARNGNQIWVINDEKLFLLDSTLTIVKEYSSEPYEYMEYVAVSDDSVYVWSRYNGIRHSDFVIRRYQSDTVSSAPAYDLILNEVVMPDTVYSDLPIGQYWAIQLRFDTIFFNVTNNSIDTIHNFRIECDWNAFGVQCSSYQQTWFMDHVSFLPGETRTFKLDPFRTDTITYGYHSPFCFWIESPDDQPDQDPSNNYACGVAKLVLATQEVKTDIHVQVYPNPLTDDLHVQYNRYADAELRIYDSLGRISFMSKMYNSETTISFSSFPDGLYFLVLLHAGLQIDTKTIMVQH
ncbi:MAG: T9SS type A sorting domain-containing protein [Saprospiraceae bacterium]